MTTDPFHEWLENQEYWVNHSDAKEQFPNARWESMHGITMQKDDNGDYLVPRRDLRRAYVDGSSIGDTT